MKSKDNVKSTIILNKFKIKFIGIKIAVRSNPSFQLILEKKQKNIIINTKIKPDNSFENWQEKFDVIAKYVLLYFSNSRSKLNKDDKTLINSTWGKLRISGGIIKYNIVVIKKIEKKI